MFTINRLTRSAGVLAAALLLAHAAQAGPPLICHPFITGDAPLLPWVDDPHNWDSRDRHYDASRLTADTLRLLTPDAPVIARMENLRRATIYAAHDEQIGIELLGALLDRATKLETPLAWFDAGYLIESYRQMGLIEKRDLLASFARSADSTLPAGLEALDGYALVQTALADATESAAEMQFAASLMPLDPAVVRVHRERAAAEALAGSLLAANLARW